MKKFKVTGIAMLLSLGVSGAVVAADNGFVTTGTQGYSWQLNNFMVAAKAKYARAGGLCGLVNNAPKSKEGKALYSYNFADLVPPGYSASGSYYMVYDVTTGSYVSEYRGEWAAPCKK